MQYRIGKAQHDRMVEHAKALLKKRDDAKWEICRIALTICYRPDKKGYIPEGAYTITKFGEDIGMNRKTLSCWILDYEHIYLKLNIDDKQMDYTERRKFWSAISKTRAKHFNFNQITNSDAKKSITPEEVQKTFDEIVAKDDLSHRLENAIRNLKHHKHIFTQETFLPHHMKLVKEYWAILHDLNIAMKDVGKPKTKKEKFMKKVKTVKKAKKKSTTPELEYGNVEILRGKHKGKVGYYDDDEDENDKCIVYLGEPFKSEFILVSPSSLKNTDVKMLAKEKLKRNHKAATDIIGLQ